MSSLGIIIAGVRVRVLLVGLGPKGSDRSQVAALGSAGAEVHFYRPWSNWRMTALKRHVDGAARRRNAR